MHRMNQIGSRLKFYNLHQTLNISINVLKSFTDIYCISSARSGFVFFISFTSFFLTLICPHHILSGMSCQAWCLVLVTWRCALPSVYSNEAFALQVRVWLFLSPPLNLKGERNTLKRATLLSPLDR